MHLPEAHIFQPDDIEIDIVRGRLSRGGAELRLRRRSLEVLAYLFDRRDRTVTKQELFDALWQQTNVTDDALVQCIKEIRRALGDDVHNPRYISTIPKTGYRFIAPLKNNGAFEASEEITRVEVEYDWEPEPALALTASAKTSRNEGRRWLQWALLAFTTLLIIGIAGGVYFGGLTVAGGRSGRLMLARDPGKKGVVVTYFENRSQDPEFDWLSQGLADMLITGFSRSDQLVVLSRDQLDLVADRGRTNSSEASGVRGADIARRVGADMFVTGSFARMGDTIRIDAQVIDDQSGASIASESLTVERPERILTDIDLLTLRLIKRLGDQTDRLAAEPVIAQSMTNDLEAYRCYSLALEKAQGLHKTEALELLQKAIDRDPDFAMAHARIGYVYAVTWGWAEKAKPHLERAFQMSDRLTEKDRLYITAWYAIANMDFPSAIPPLREIIQKYPSETEAYVRLGYLLRGEEQFDNAIEVMQQGLAVDPDSSALYNSLGLLFSLLGKHDQAIAMHQRYVALEPREPNAYDSLGMSYQWAGRYDEAIAEYRRALDLEPTFEIAHAHIGVAYYQTGRYQAALEALKNYATVAPSALERSRANAYMAHVYRALGDLKSAAAAARVPAKEGYYLFDPWMVFNDLHDITRRRSIEKQMLIAPPFNTRGSRNTTRYDHLFRGYIEVANGRPEAGLTEALEAIRHPAATWEIDPAEDCAADILLKMGRYDEAIAEYQRVLDVNPRYPLAHFHIAQALDRKGETAEAAKFYRQFLDLWSSADGNVPEIVAARRRLATES